MKKTQSEAEKEILKMKRNQYRHILRTQLASFGYKDVFKHDLDRLLPSKT